MLLSIFLLFVLIIYHPVHNIMHCRNRKLFECPVCNTNNSLSDCFRDRAVEYELRNSTLKCLNPSCPWEGESKFYEVYIQLQSKLKFKEHSRIPSVDFFFSLSPIHSITHRMRYLVGWESYRFCLKVLTGQVYCLSIINF